MGGKCGISSAPAGSVREDEGEIEVPAASRHGGGRHRHTLGQERSVGNASVGLPIHQGSRATSAQHCGGPAGAHPAAQLLELQLADPECSEALGNHPGVPAAAGRNRPTKRRSRPDHGQPKPLESAQHALGQSTARGQHHVLLGAELHADPLNPASEQLHRANDRVRDRRLRPNGLKGRVIDVDRDHYHAVNLDCLVKPLNKKQPQLDSGMHRARRDPSPRQQKHRAHAIDGDRPGEA
eukprot:14067629-Alexandrium_andersonii.AAC.1